MLQYHFVEQERLTTPYLMRKAYILITDSGNRDHRFCPEYVDVIAGRDAGKLLAKNLRVGLGDELVILGQGLDGSVAATVVKIKGIFGSGQDEFDRSTIHIPLKYFQDVYLKDFRF